MGKKKDIGAQKGIGTPPVPEKSGGRTGKKSCEPVASEENHENGPRWSWARNQMGKVSSYQSVEIGEQMIMKNTTHNPIGGVSAVAANPAGFTVPVCFSFGMRVGWPHGSAIRKTSDSALSLGATDRREFKGVLATGVTFLSLVLAALVTGCASVGHNFN